MNFKPNDKVVCVDDSPGKVTGERALILGAVYAVERTMVVREGPGVFLVGIIGEFAWASRRFRLVSEVQAENRAARKQGIGKWVKP